MGLTIASIALKNRIHATLVFPCQEPSRRRACPECRLKVREEETSRNRPRSTPSPSRRTRKASIAEFGRGERFQDIDFVLIGRGTSAA
jgi:hypothetical protein